MYWVFIIYFKYIQTGNVHGELNPNFLKEVTEHFKLGNKNDGKIRSAKIKSM